jgi:hypothetical protein
MSLLEVFYSVVQVLEFVEPLIIWDMKNLLEVGYMRHGGPISDRNI